MIGSSFRGSLFGLFYSTRWNKDKLVFEAILLVAWDKVEDCSLFVQVFGALAREKHATAPRLFEPFHVPKHDQRAIWILSWTCHIVLKARM